LGQAWYAVVVHCVEPSTSAPGGGPALLRDQRPHARSRAASLGGTGRAAPPRRRRRCASAHQLRGVHANALLREGVPLNVSNANSDAARWAWPPSGSGAWPRRDHPDRPRTATADDPRV